VVETESGSDELIELRFPAVFTLYEREPESPAQTEKDKEKNYERDKQQPGSDNDA
jgi:hypothetical protein